MNVTTCAQLVEKYWPAAYMVAGKRNTAIAIESVMQGKSLQEVFADTPGGRDMDEYQVLMAIFGAAGFIKTCFDIKDRLKSSMAKVPREALEDAVKQEAEKQTMNLTADQLRSLCNDVFDDGGGI
jgi:hypothetical protein